MMFRAASQRGLVQLIDVSGYDMSLGELTLSAIISGKGNFPPSGIMKMAGYNDVNNKWVGVDGVQLSLVAEPATASLLALGGILALLRRRKH